MKKEFLPGTGGKNLVVVVLFLAAITLVVLMPSFFVSEASTEGKGPIQRVESHDEHLPNYDIRTDKPRWREIAEMRERANINASAIADLREEFVRGEEILRTRTSSLKIEYSDRLRAPEVISPEPNLGSGFLTGASRSSRSEILRSFLKQNSGLLGLTERGIDSLIVKADYRNPENDLGFAILKQEIGGIPVFQGTVSAGFTKNGEIVRVINNLAPAIDSTSVSSDFGDSGSAVGWAAEHIGHELRLEEKSLPVYQAGSELKAVFGSGDWATTAEKMYFPTEPGVVVPAWRVLIWLPRNAYYVIVDAHSGKLLWRKNIAEDQTQVATYNVYANANAMIPVADNPNPFTPGPVSPLPGSQGTRIPRTVITRIGNEAPYTFNNLGWITDGNNDTDGNAVEAGVDRELPNGIDPSGRAVGNPNRVFDFPFNPGNPSGIPDVGDPPLPVGISVTPCVAAGTSPPLIDFQKASVTQLFYISNWFHDETYRLGFTEPAFNFQHDNFGRGGLGNDRISSEGQECSGTNGGNFSSPADGSRGRMQLFIWTSPDPDFDGALDADVAIHELTHGLSNRLHGNSTGLTTNMARSMGEGWSDFYAHAMLSEPGDPPDGIYTVAGYSFYRPLQPNNSYYGIRRFPKAIMSSLGGPNNRPHNPLTFADIDGSQINLSDGAFPPNGGGSADQVHNAGEVWSSALWEVRAKYIQRLGWELGNRRILQHVTDGMKLSPLAPTFLQARDSILSAALADGVGADVADVWAGFAIRGMGYSASVQNPGTGTGNARVTQAFDLPNLTQSPQLTIADPAGNGNGFPDPGESVIISLPLTNTTGITAVDVTAQLVGGSSANYGNIANGQTVIRDFSFTIPSGASCGSLVNLTFNVNSSFGPTSYVRSVAIGEPATTFTENFDNVTAPAFPAGWTAVPVSGGVNFVTTTTNPDTPPNSAFALDPTTVGGGTDLTSPPIPITAAAASVSFRNRYATEAGWDGGVLEISIGGGQFQDILTAGGSFLQNGYSGVLGANGVNNPLAGRQAWTGDSGGYVTTIARLPALAAGQSVQLRWRFGADDNTAVTGWNVDTVSVSGTYQCIIVDPFGARSDFDGDGRTDISVYRPDNGNWYLNRSSEGILIVNFGLAEDIIAPGDYDGDGITDIAVWRPSNGVWYVFRSSTSDLLIVQFGLAGDIPVAGDYDGDGLTDIAVFRPSTSVWYVLKSTGGTLILGFGTDGDIPVRGDFDGDGLTDIAVYRGGQWWIARSSGGVSVTGFGLPGDKPVPANYDGDGKDDIAVFRPSDGVWYILRSSDVGVTSIQFGLSEDIPAPGDYDGDGKSDQAVYRDGVWYLNRSTAGVSIVSFGLPADRPTPAGYIP